MSELIYIIFLIFRKLKGNKNDYFLILDLLTLYF